MKSFRTKKNLAIALSVLLVAAIVVLCIALRQKSDADVDPTLTLVCTPADADGVCTVDVELTGLRRWPPASGKQSAGRRTLRGGEHRRGLRPGAADLSRHG